MATPTPRPPSPPAAQKPPMTPPAPTKPGDLGGRY
jgi:hypothetical protein